MGQLGSLQSITDKLKLLYDMMHMSPPGTTESDNTPKYTPLERLTLLREVTEDARTFQVGGEDKIRVATNTCESVSITAIYSHIPEADHALARLVLDLDFNLSPLDSFLSPPLFPSRSPPTPAPSSFSPLWLPLLLDSCIFPRPTPTLRLPRFPTPSPTDNSKNRSRSIRWHEPWSIECHEW